MPVAEVTWFVNVIQTGGRFVVYCTWNRSPTGAVQFKTKPPGVMVRLEILIAGDEGAVPSATRKNC